MRPMPDKKVPGGNSVSRSRANLVTVRLGSNGDVCFYSYGRTSVIADITGYLT